VKSAKSVDSFSAEPEIERRIASRLGQLRTEHGWSLEDVAERTSMSRATLSRIERSELSPTAAMLGALCTLYGWTLSRLMADAEAPPPNYIPAAEQAHWTDPESGYRRRAVSPPSPELRGEMVEVHIPAGATVSFETSPIAGLEHHLWLLEGAVTIGVDGASVSLRSGDCLRYVLNGPSTFHNAGRRAARYVIAMVRP
jgi:transcriptional regulator with XRE-family HTH domain